MWGKLKFIPVLATSSQPVLTRPLVFGCSGNDSAKRERKMRILCVFKSIFDSIISQKKAKQILPDNSQEKTHIFTTFPLFLPQKEIADKI